MGTLVSALNKYFESRGVRAIRLSARKDSRMSVVLCKLDLLKGPLWPTEFSLLSVGFSVGISPGKSSAASPSAAWPWRAMVGGGQCGGRWWSEPLVPNGP